MLRDSLGLTDVGAKNFRRGVFFCTLANLVLMAPIGILFLLVSDFMDHLVAGAPLPALAPYLAGCVGILALMVLTQWAEYANTYHKVYEESARKRTDLAEHLRRLPLSFFGRASSIACALRCWCFPVSAITSSAAGTTQNAASARRQS